MLVMAASPLPCGVPLSGACLSKSSRVGSALSESGAQFPLGASGYDVPVRLWQDHPLWKCPRCGCERFHESGEVRCQACEFEYGDNDSTLIPTAVERWEMGIALADEEGEDDPDFQPDDAESDSEGENEPHCTSGPTHIVNCTSGPTPTININLNLNVQVNVLAVSLGGGRPPQVNVTTSTNGQTWFQTGNM